MKNIFVFYLWKYEYLGTTVSNSGKIDMKGTEGSGNKLHNY